MPQPQISQGGTKKRSILRMTFPLLLWNAIVAFFVGSELINILVISGLLWPGEPFHVLEISFLIAARLWADGLFALVWGILVDKPRIKRKLLFTITGSVTGIIILFNALAPIGKGMASFNVWIIIRVCIGLFMSAGGPMFTSLSSDLLTQEERSQFFGYAGIFWMVFQTLGTLISAIMFQQGLWRNFIGFAAIGFFCWVAVFRLYFREPKRAAQDEAVKHLIQTTDIKYEYEMNPATLRKTMLSRTNLLILFEGFFMSTVLSLVNFLLIPYVLSPPHNISAVSFTLLMMMYGIPGSLIGMTVLAKFSDKYGGKNLKRRIKLIVGSVLIGVLGFLIIFFIPFPSLTPGQGNDFKLLMSYPQFYMIGILIVISNAFFSMYGINQAPIVQEINLPEGRGKIASWNQFIEVFNAGTGPVLAGIFLTLFSNNYRLTFQILLLLIIPGILMWLFALRFIEKDMAVVHVILQLRAEEMQNNMRKA